MTELHIEDLGTIDRLDLVFGPGLTVLTGETGAGKTMLVEAISLLVGGRADAARVRAGAGEARVEGRFVIDDATGGEGAETELVVSRVVPVDGRSRAYVNGRLATVGQLVDIGERLVDIHGQHVHQSLLAAAVQRAALDEFTGVDLAPLRAARAELTEIDASLAALGGDTRARAREIDLLRFQVDEISAAAVASPDEEVELVREDEALSDAEAHRSAGFRAVEALAGDGGASDAVGSAIAFLSQRSPFDPAVDRLRALAAELTDVASDLRRVSEDLEDDPERLSAVRARRQALRELRRKYGESLADVLAYLEESSARLAEIESYDAKVAELESRRESAIAAERRAAAKVAAARRAGAKDLGRRVTAHLATLAMDKASVSVEVAGDDPADEVTFMLAANPGLPAAPLAKVASGGELSRTMLAIRMVLTSGPPVLVFDEVDAGIGGSAANALAAALRGLGESHQVLIVTHLAQVAAVADTHVRVDKQIVGRSGAEITVTGATVVAGRDRVDEVARMLSGDSTSTAARRHAEELLGKRSRR